MKTYSIAIIGFKIEVLYISLTSETVRVVSAHIPASPLRTLFV